MSEASSGAIRSPKTGWGPFFEKHPDQIRLIIVLLALVAIFSIWSPEAFSTSSNLKNMLRQGSVLLIVTIGQMFPLLIRGLDVSVGSLMALTSVLGSTVMVQFGLIPGIVVGVGSATLLGVINGYISARFNASPFVVTLGMMSFASGLALQITQGRAIIGLPESFTWFGSRDLIFLPSAFFIAAVIAILASLILYKTRMGVYFYAIGGNEEATWLSGVSLLKYKIIAYGLSGLCAGVAGMVLTSRVFSGQPTLGTGYELLSIATAVIGGVAIAGGIGSISGVLLGTAVMVVLNTGMNIAGLSTFVQSMITGIVIVMAVVWDRIRVGRNRNEKSG